MRKFTVVLIAGFLLLAGCESAPPAPTAPAVDLVAEQAKLHDLEANWVKDAAAKDVEKIASHYADDAVFMTPGAPPFKGKDAIRAAWKGMLDDPNLKLNFSSDRVEISAGGDLATTKGSYTLTMTDPKTKKLVDDKGSYLTVFKKQADGGRKAVEDINTSEVPPK